MNMKSKAKQPKEAHLVTQRKPVAAKQAAVGDILQRYQMETLQRQSIDEEEELLQGKFETTQLLAVDEEEELL